MKQLIKRIIPEEFFSNHAHVRALVLGLVYLFFLITQLFTFERFPELFADSKVLLVIPHLAFVIVLLELASLPALFSMKMTRLAWRLSTAAVVATACTWLAVSLSLAVAGYGKSIALSGATFASSNGWWLVIFTAFLSLTAVVIVRELPHRR